MPDFVLIVREEGYTDNEKDFVYKYAKSYHFNSWADLVNKFDEIADAWERAFSDEDYVHPYIGCRPSINGLLIDPLVEED